MKKQTTILIPVTCLISALLLFTTLHFTAVSSNTEVTPAASNTFTTNPDQADTSTYSFSEFLLLLDQLPYHLCMALTRYDSTLLQNRCGNNPLID